MAEKRYSNKSLPTTTKRPRGSHPSKKETRETLVSDLPKDRISQMEWIFSLIALILSIMAIWQTKIDQNRTAAPNIQIIDKKVAILSDDNFRFTFFPTSRRFSTCIFQDATHITKQIAL